MEFLINVHQQRSFNVSGKVFLKIEHQTYMNNVVEQSTKSSKLQLQRKLWTTSLLSLLLLKVLTQEDSNKLQNHQLDHLLISTLLSMKIRTLIQKAWFTQYSIRLLKTVNSWLTLKKWKRFIIHLSVFLTTTLSRECAQLQNIWNQNLQRSRNLIVQQSSQQILKNCLIFLNISLKSIMIS